MIRRALRVLCRQLPHVGRRVALFSALYGLQRGGFFQGFACLAVQDGGRRYIEKIEAMSIKIKMNGQVVGIAYCFADNYLVSASEQLMENRRNGSYEFYLGERRLKGSFRIIGNYENLTFIQCTLADGITPIGAANGQPERYGDVDLLQKKEFMSVRRGCFITEDSGYGIVDGEGEVGSLVATKEGVAGIIVQIGRGEDKGFIRTIKWASLIPILNYVKGRPLHLGISAQSIQNQQGLTIVRVAPNSPLKNEIMMGDVILLANNQRSPTPQSLFRICVQSGGQVDLQILREGKPMDVRIRF